MHSSVIRKSLGIKLQYASKLSSSPKATAENCCKTAKFQYFASNREMTNSEKKEQHVLGMLHNNHFNVFSDALAFLELTQVSQLKSIEISKK